MERLECPDGMETGRCKDGRYETGLARSVGEKSGQVCKGGSLNASATAYGAVECWQAGRQAGWQGGRVSGHWRVTTPCLEEDAHSSSTVRHTGTAEDHQGKA